MERTGFGDKMNALQRFVAYGLCSPKAILLLQWFVVRMANRCTHAFTSKIRKAIVTWHPHKSKVQHNLICVSLCVWNGLDLLDLLPRVKMLVRACARALVCSLVKLFVRQSV